MGPLCRMIYALLLHQKINCLSQVSIRVCHVKCNSKRRKSSCGIKRDFEDLVVTAREAEFELQNKSTKAVSKPQVADPMLEQLK